MKKKFRVVIVTSWYPTKIDCRSGTFAIHQFAKALSESGKFVRVLNTQKYNFKKYTIDGIEVACIPRIFLRYSELQKVTDLKCNVSRSIHMISLLFLRFLIKCIFRTKPDLSIIHGGVGYHLDLLKGKDWPKVIILHSSDVRYIDAINNVDDSVKAIAFRSKSVKSKFADKVNFNVSHNSILLSGISKDRLLPYDEYSFEFSSSGPRLICVAKLIKRKNVDLLIKALSLVKSRRWSLDIYGDGPLMHELIELVEELRLNKRIFFHGHLSHEKMLEEYKKFDAFVLLSEQETFGLVYLEALSQGLIVACAKGEGVDGLIENGINGFVIDLSSVENVASSLNEIIGLSRRYIESIKRKAFDTASSLLEENTNYAYTSFIERVLEGE